jgi:RNA polymerase sigma-70 factor (ECF subfamily)
MNDGRSRLDAGILDQGSVDPAEQVAVGNLVAAIQGVLEKLSPNQRAAFRLGRVEGLRYGDIAEHLGITVSAVKSLIFRATNELRRELRPFLQVSDDPEKFRTANNNKGTSVEPVPLSR